MAKRTGKLTTWAARAKAAKGKGGKTKAKTKTATTHKGTAKR